MTRSLLRSHRRLVIGLAVGIPSLSIAVIIAGPWIVATTGVAPSTLPLVNASLNAVVTSLLLMGWWAIRHGALARHLKLMIAAVIITAIFLTSYVVHHTNFPSMPYQGAFPWLYYPILITHIPLAISVVPLVLITLYRGLDAQFDRHRKLARWTLPIWLYVSITGVLVYLFMIPYY